MTDDAIWTVAIAPLPRADRRFPPSLPELVRVIDDHAVALRGWNYPHVPHRDPQSILGLEDGGIEAHVDALDRYKEVWRIHPSGLFTHRWRVREDGTAYRGSIHFVATIYTVTEVFEFGRRLYGGDDSVEAVAFRLHLEGVLGRPGSGDDVVDLPYHQKAQRNECRFELSVARADLAVDVKSPASEAAASLFAQLGFTDISRSFVESRVENLLGGRI